MNSNTREHRHSLFSSRLGLAVSLSVGVLSLPLDLQGAAWAQSANSQAKMSQMLNQFEQGKRPTYTTGGSRPAGSASGMPGYANMMRGGRPSNMGGYAAMGNRGGSAQMLQLMKQKMSRMQSGGGPGPLMQLMQKRSGGAPNMMPGMGGGPGPGMGMQSGLFAKMMQQDNAFNNNMKRQQMSHGMGASGGMLGSMMGGMKRPGMGMGMPGGMGMSGMGRPGMGMSGGMPGGILGRMQQKASAPRAGSPFAAKPAAPAGSGNMSELEKQMESQYGK